MDLPASLAVVAARQHGLLSRDQCREGGLSATTTAALVSQRHWRLARPGVFAINGAPRTLPQEVLAVCLVGTGQTAASHQTAATL